MSQERGEVPGTATAPSPLLEVSIGHEYGHGPDATPAIDHIEFAVEAGQFVSIVGPSGCGKSTLLRCISGLMPPSRGEVSLNGHKVTGVPEEMAIVFQDYSRSLFPWKRVAGNVAFPLVGTSLSKAERQARISESLAAVGLEEFADHYPWQLSGGMQQRVAIARALAYRPKLMLMDEPFASVDAQTRSELEDLLLEVQVRMKMTVLLVTHDIDESVYMADVVQVLSTRPTRLLATIPTGLPRPRDQIATKELPEYVRLRSQVAGLIRRQTPGAEPAAARLAPGTDLGPGP